MKMVGERRALAAMVLAFYFGLFLMNALLGDDLARGLVDHDGAERHAQDARLTILAVAVGALAVLAALGVPVRLELVVDEIVRVNIAQENDIAPAAAIAAIGAAPRLIFLAAEADAAAATVAGG